MYLKRKELKLIKSIQELEKEVKDLKPETKAEDLKPSRKNK